MIYNVVLLSAIQSESVIHHSFLYFLVVEGVCSCLPLTPQVPVQNRYRHVSAPLSCCNLGLSNLRACRLVGLQVCGQCASQVLSPLARDRGPVPCQAGLSGPLTWVFSPCPPPDPDSAQALASAPSSLSLSFLPIWKQAATFSAHRILLFSFSLLCLVCMVVFARIKSHHSNIHR